MAYFKVYIGSMQKRSDRIEFLHPDGKPHEGLQDLSETGLALFRKKPIAPDALLTVQIETIQIQGKVVYCQEKVGGYKIGIHFVEIPAKDKPTLVQLVDKFSRGTSIQIRLEI